MKRFSTLVLAVAMLASMMISASAMTGTITPADSTEITAGQNFDVILDFDSLLGMREYTVQFTFATADFVVDDSDNTDYNFGTKARPKYEKMYVCEDLLAARKDEVHSTSMLSDFKTTTYVDGDKTIIKIYGTDSDGYDITEDLDTEEYVKNFGINITAAADLVAGTYPVEVFAKIGDVNSATLYEKTETINFVVKGEDIDPVKPETTVVKTFPKRFYADNALTTVGVILEGTDYDNATEIKAGIKTQRDEVNVNTYAPGAIASATDEDKSYVMVTLGEITETTVFQPTTPTWAFVEIDGTLIEGEKVTENVTSADDAGVGEDYKG